MKEQFPEFYSPRGTEFKKLWKEALFVLDTNVLLNLYQYPPKTQAKLFATLRKLKKQLWIPHQVALEFYKRRLSIICTQEKNYSGILSALDNFGKQYTEHPFLYDKQIVAAIKNSSDSIRNELKKLDASRPKWLLDDKVLENIEKLIGGKVGVPYDDSILKNIYIEGSERYEREVPPGYKDIDKDKSDKSKTRRYGDLLIWYQIIDKAKEAQKPIIFVTDERKEDWWWKEDGGRNMGARFELKKEMLDKTGMLFHIYQTDQFIEHSREHLQTKFGAAFIEEIKKVSEIIANDASQGVGLSASSSSSSLISDIKLEGGAARSSSLGVDRIAGEASTTETAQSSELKPPRERKERETL